MNFYENFHTTTLLIHARTSFIAMVTKMTLNVNETAPFFIGLLSLIKTEFSFYDVLPLVNIFASLKFLATSSSSSVKVKVSYKI